MAGALGVATPAHFSKSFIAAMPAMIFLKPYIHLNPIRANLVTHLCSYPFSIYPAFIVQVKAPKFLGHWQIKKWSYCLIVML